VAGPSGLGPWLLLVDGHGNGEAFPRVAGLLGAEVLDATDPDRALLPARLDSHERLVVAGPGCARHLARWRTVADRLGAHLAAVIVVRHPAEAFGAGESDEVARWLDLLLDFEHATRQLPHALVRHEDLIEDWRAAIRRVEKETGVPLLGAASVAEVSEAETHGHETAPGEPDWAALEVPPDVRDLAARTYAALCSVADGVGDLDFVDSLRAERAAG
jgi:hypothetical protein